jgi:hypothetical protein
MKWLAMLEQEPCHFWIALGSIASLDDRSRQKLWALLCSLASVPIYWKNENLEYIGHDLSVFQLKHQERLEF